MSVDIFNRPPTIADDTLHYTLHFPPPESEPSNLTALSALILDYVRQLLPKDFLWHRDGFELRVAEREGKGKGKAKARDAGMGSGAREMREGDAWLEGTMRVGDAVDDEWAVVFLLREISKKWDCIISVTDSDGQFLLIEAADSLPRWVTPQNAQNRVWLYQGQLHLIPLEHASSGPRPARDLGAGDSDDELDPSDSAWLSIPDALRFVRDPAVQTVAPQAVQAAVNGRIARYPEAFKAHIHHTLAFLPLPLARALSTHPELAQRAAETFYTRDALQLRAAHKMSRFPPFPSVLVRVTLTRVAYAQLRGQKWLPPRVFGPQPRGEKERRWWEVGAMIAAGCEMLYQETRARNAQTAAAAAGGAEGKEAKEARLEALRRDPGWGRYLETLKRAGYFGSEVEGSRVWKEREERAVEAYVQARATEDAARPSFASLIESALSAPGPSEDELKASAQEGEDDDSWLDVGQEELETLLARASTGNAPPTNPSSTSTQRAQEKEEPKIQELKEDGTPANEDVDMEAEEERLAEKEASRLKEMARKVEAFVEGEGDVEGATFPDDILEEDDDMRDSDDPTDSDADVDMELTPEERKRAMDALVQPLAEGEYGKMPADWKKPQPMSDTALAEAEARHTALTSGDPPADAGKGKGKARANEDLEPLDMTQGHRAPLFEREKYEGHSSDSSLDEAGQGLSDSEEEGSDAPQVVGELGDEELDVDMQEEEEEFLRFARKELGISDEGWGEIVRQREGEGRFVPRSAAAGKKPAQEEDKEVLGPKPPKGKSAAKGRTSADKAAEKAVRWMDATPAPQKAPRERRQGGPRPNANPNLDSFERVMEAMEGELARAKAEKSGKGKKSSASPVQSNTKAQDAKGKGKAPASPDEDEEDADEMLRAMDAELKSALKKGEGDEGDSDDEETPMDYNLIKNFLESFKSQAGLAGPVSGMVGRLEKGWVWPRDEGEEGKH